MARKSAKPGELEKEAMIEAANLEKQKQVLERQLADMMKKKKIPIHNYRGHWVRFGLVSDTHIGSICERNDVLRLAYDVFKREKIKIVYHAGDMVDGEGMWRGHVYEIYAHGVEAQLEQVIKNYPRIPGIKTYFITGSHDLCFYKKAGVDIGTLIGKAREDLIYMGQEEQDVLVKSPGGIVRVRLFHPGGGTAYALSYQPQKIVESYTGGRKPHALFIGHYHKSEVIPGLRNIQVVQAGCCQSQTSYMRRKRLAAHIGFWIIEMVIKKNTIVRFRSEFFPYYEGEEDQTEELAKA